jgi:hypothetical protein
MEGPAISRLKWHLEKARDYIDVYRWQLENTTPDDPELLNKAQMRIRIAEEIYNVIKGARCVKI